MTAAFLDHLRGVYPFVPADSNTLFDGTPYVLVPVNATLWESNGGMTRACVEIINWLRLNPRKDTRVLHEPEGGVMRIRNDSSNYNSSYSWNEKHRFYFSDLSYATAFASALEELLFTRGPLFPSLASLQFEPGDGMCFAGIINYALESHDFNPKTIALWFWCQDNMKGKLFVQKPNLIFEKEEDLVLFKLALTGDETVALPVLEVI